MFNYQRFEDDVVLSHITNKNALILDVGCGLGRYLIPLSKKDYKVVGIDKNVDIVNDLKNQGYKVYTVDEINKINVQFDYIIISHVIEHIPSSMMVQFLDGYLKYLKPDGELIIATPLMYNGFYDDYDHIRPYLPQSIQVLYSDYQQIQEKPHYRLKTTFIWVRKWPRFIQSHDGSILIKCFNGLMLGLYVMSGGFISKITGWVGGFRKV